MNIDVTEDFYIEWVGDGFKLLPSENKAKSSFFIKPINNFLDASSVCFYIKDTNHRMQLVNEVLVKTHNLVSGKDILRKTIERVFKKETASYLHDFDTRVLKNQRFDSKELNAYFRNDNVFFAIDYKFPLYDSTCSLIGILGISITDADSDIPLSNAIQTLAEIGIINLMTKSKTINVWERKINDIYFSQREWECLPHLSRGISAKELAKYLDIEKRTAEQYIESVRIKMNVSSKSELAHILTRLL